MFLTVLSHLESEAPPPSCAGLAKEICTCWLVIFNARRFRYQSLKYSNICYYHTYTDTWEILQIITNRFINLLLRHIFLPLDLITVRVYHHTTARLLQILLALSALYKNIHLNDTTVISVVYWYSYSITNMVRGKVKSQRITTPGERKTSSVGKAVTVPSPAQSASKSVTKVKLTAPQAAAVPSCCNCTISSPVSEQDSHEG